MSEISMGNLYEVNQNLSSQMPLMTAPQTMGLYPKLADWFENHIGRYAMLYCHEMRDITLFNKDTSDYGQAAKAVKILFECIENRGGLVSCDPADGDAWEIWIRVENEDLTTTDRCYYLFNYDNAVIEV